MEILVVLDRGAAFVDSAVAGAKGGIIVTAEWSGGRVDVCAPGGRPKECPGPGPGFGYWFCCLWLLDVPCEDLTRADISRKYAMDLHFDAMLAFLSDSDYRLGNM